MGVVRVVTMVEFERSTGAVVVVVARDAVVDVASSCGDAREMQ